MKLYGYEEGQPPVEGASVNPLAEVTLVASSKELRKMAQFLNDAANTMESMGSAYSHEHLADKQSGFEASPHFVVFSPTENVC